MAAVEQALAGVPCSALAASASDGALRVRGYLSSGFGDARLKETLGRIPGAQTMNLDVQPFADDKCGVAGLLAPYWKQNTLAASAASIHTRPRDAPLLEGDALVLDVATPAWDSYVYVDYFSSDGGVVHLVPSPRLRANQAPASYTATIGGAGNWVVSKPLGTDMIVLLATPAPLFEGLRPEAEHAQDYLRVLEKQLAQLDAKHGRDRIVADFLQITTKPRK